MFLKSGVIGLFLDRDYCPLSLKKSSLEIINTHSCDEMKSSARYSAQVGVEIDNSHCFMEHPLGIFNSDLDALEAMNHLSKEFISNTEWSLLKNGIYKKSARVQRSPT